MSAAFARSPSADSTVSKLAAQMAAAGVAPEVKAREALVQELRSQGAAAAQESIQIAAAFAERMHSMEDVKAAEDGYGTHTHTRCTALHASRCRSLLFLLLLLMCRHCCRQPHSC